ncbi:hypothetical protein CTA1_9422 [Colletotrichum tanaceti]|uniref:Uncharacterized protein n=1 Tax=Colletotrichum tanaceti TaxID=1306861 RepID=A0A4U6XHE1_9PEZI|nr:hypothetical protein CTA1_9422 [Colletotrichum tanaceti]
MMQSRATSSITKEKGAVASGERFKPSDRSLKLTGLVSGGWELVFSV